MLVLWPCICLFVCLSVSVTSRSSVETVERIELIFLAPELPSTYLTLCCKETRSDRLMKKFCLNERLATGEYLKVT